jgi:NADH:ubiquinone oxidoreductase subunit K
MIPQIPLNFVYNIASSTAAFAPQVFPIAILAISIPFAFFVVGLIIDFFRGEKRHSYEGEDTLDRLSDIPDLSDDML